MIPEAIGLSRPPNERGTPDGRRGPVRSEVFIVVFASGAALLYATAGGVAVTPDGVIYLDAARHLARGEGYVAFQYGEVRPLSHYPPFYPMLLALHYLAGWDPLELSGRIMNAALVGLCAGLVAVTASVAGAARRAAVASAAIYLLSVDGLRIHTALLTEPLYLVLHIACLGALAEYVRTGRASRLVVAACAAGVASLTRFPGVVLIATGVVGIALLSRSANRVRTALTWGFCASVPLALWLAQRALAGVSATGRDPALHPPELRETAYDLTMTVSAWVFPYFPDAGAGRAAIALAFAGFIAATLWRTWRDGGPGRGLAGIVAIHLLLYGLFLLTSITLMDAQTRLTARFLLPALVSIAPLVGIRRPAVAVAIALALTPAWLDAVQRHHEHGHGYTSSAWRSFAWGRLHDAVGDREIYSNAPELIYFHGDTPAREIPAPVDRWTRRPDTTHARRSAEMTSSVVQGRAVIVYFRGIPRRFVPDVDEIASGIGAPVFEWDRNTAVIGWTGSTGPTREDPRAVHVSSSAAEGSGD